MKSLTRRQMMFPTIASSFTLFTEAFKKSPTTTLEFLRCWLLDGSWGLQFSVGILLGRLFSRCMLFRRHFYLFGKKIMYFSEDAFWNWKAFLTNRARVTTYTNVWNIILSIFRSPKIIFVGLKSVICMGLYQGGSVPT